LRYGLGDGVKYTLEDVGHIFKVTRDRIRQIEAKAIKKLQQPSRSEFLDPIYKREDVGKDKPIKFYEDKPQQTNE